MPQETVEDYSNRFTKLLQQLGPRHRPSDDESLSLFMEGFIFSIQRAAFVTTSPASMSQAKDLALRVQSIATAEKSSSRGPTSTAHGQGNQPASAKPSKRQGFNQQPQRQQTLRMLTALENGDTQAASSLFNQLAGNSAQSFPPPHHGASAPLAKLTDDERQRLALIGACFRCRQQGHIAALCPNGRAATNPRPPVSTHYSPGVVPTYSSPTPANAKPSRAQAPRRGTATSPTQRVFSLLQHGNHGSLSDLDDASLLQIIRDLDASKPKDPSGHTTSDPANVSDVANDNYA
jgi:hypothetical protein